MLINITYLINFSDPEMKTLLKPYTEKLHSLVKEVLGYAKEDLLAPKCSTGECAIGNFVADAFLNAVSLIKGNL